MWRVPWVLVVTMPPVPHTRVQDLEEAKSRTADVEAKYSKQVDKLQGEIKALSQRLKASTGSAEQALQASKDKADELKRAMKQAQADADKARKAADAEHKKAMREAWKRLAQQLLWSNGTWRWLLPSHK